MTEQSMWKLLIGKRVKIALKLQGGKLSIVEGTVIDCNDSFVVNRDSNGKIHFINTKMIDRIHEIEPEQRSSI